ncbi:MAG TPA: methionyl-tRNA formyltransferase [Chitinophagaceae bacterium]|nr:methionyl-tRNA formyltransferase [Chitinophagaceae bacterium]
MRIIFMGTPEFAVDSLSALLDNGYNVVAVVTTPDKPAGRGRTMHESDVKKFANTKGIPILQPVKLRNPDFLEELKSFHADLQVVVAFRMLPKIVWNMPTEGTINLHASLLPQYRGAAPINRAVMNGETESGVTTFKLQHEIDTGQIIDQEKVSIGENDTAGDLHDKLMTTGASLLLKTIQKIKEGSANLIKQSTLEEAQPLKHAPKIFKEDCRIDWNKSIDKIHNHIRGLSPYPGAWTTLNGKTFKIFESRKEKTVTDKDIGEVETDHKSYVKVSCKGGYLSLKKIQPSGKKRMDIEAFLRGFRNDFSFE